MLEFSREHSYSAFEQRATALLAASARRADLTLYVGTLLALRAKSRRPHQTRLTAAVDDLEEPALTS